MVHALKMLRPYLLDKPFEMHMDNARPSATWTARDQVLLDTDHTQLPSRSLLLLRWMGPSKVLARTAPNTYRLNVPATERTCAEFNIERLRPYLHRPDHLPVGGAAAPPPPVVGADGRPEHEVQELLKFKMRWGRPYVLVRWARHDASGDRST